jgi:hypothetical protein
LQCGGDGRVAFGQLVEEHLVAGLFADIMHVNVAQNALGINDEDSAFREPVRAQNAVFLSGGAVGPKIAEQGIGDAAQAVGPGL